MSVRWTALATGAFLLGGASIAFAQTVIVEEGYGAPVYAPPRPVYAAPVVVAPAPRVYVAPAPIYAAPPVHVRRYAPEVVVTEPAWDW